MKLSNKILLGFFGFAFLYLTAVFAEVRFSGTPNVIDNHNSIAETVDLPADITYLVLNNCEKEIKVFGGDRPRLEVRSFTGDLLKSVNYKIDGDTFTLSGLDTDDTRAVRISLFVPKSTLKGISVNSSFIVVEGLEQASLQVSESAGRAWLSNNTIGKIETDLSNKSYLEINDAKLDTVSVKIETSQMYITSPVGRMQGSMKNDSFLQINELREIQLEKDASSNLRMY